MEKTASKGYAAYMDNIRNRVKTVAKQVSKLQKDPTDVKKEDIDECLLFEQQYNGSGVVNGYLVFGKEDYTKEQQKSFEEGMEIIHAHFQ